jgi:urease accessory protein
MNVQFINSLSSASGTAPDVHSHDHGAPHSHDHGGDHGHTHEHLDHAGTFIRSTYLHRRPNILFMLTGKFSERELPDYSARNFEERGFTIGIGGYVTTILRTTNVNVSTIVQ